MALMDFFRDMTEEQKKKVLVCGSVEDLLALAEAEGMKMTDEQIEAAAGMDPRVLFSAAGKVFCINATYTNE